MSREATAAKITRPPAATVSYTVHFQKRPCLRTQRQQEPKVGCVPRVTHLLALAHKIDGMIRAGEIRDWAEAARLVGITRARMTQMANLLLLAPDIQEAILDVPRIVKGSDPITERELRKIVAKALWTEQLRWETIGEPSSHTD